MVVILLQHEGKHANTDACCEKQQKKATELGFRFELCIFLKCSYSTAGLYLNTVAFTGSSFCTLLHPLASAVSHLTCQLALCFSRLPAQKKSLCQDNAADHQQALSLDARQRFSGMWGNTRA